MIHAIFACDDNWGIGKDGGLPWPHNSADLKWFKESTGNSTVVMGSRTWESLPKKPLPNRFNIVITKQPMEQEFNMTPMYLEYFKSRHIYFSNQNIWIIGGAQLLESCLDIVDEIWLGRIRSTYDCDTFLPKDLILQKFELYEHYFDGTLTTEKYKRKTDEANIVSN